MVSKFNYLNFDIYSKRISFFYKNHEKIGSYFGLSLTIIYILILLILFSYYLTTTFQRKDMIVYDSTMHSQEMPIMNIDSNNLYFAFGLEDPNSFNRFIDEKIYYPELAFIDRIKINGEFITKNIINLEYEECKKENFGENYQHLFSNGELQNSYCLKNFNFSLNLSGGFKYEKMSYINLNIFPCKNTTKNNNHCKPKEEIDYYLSSGYFSILLKNFGLNPSNYSFPILPTVKDLYTSIGKRFYKNYIIKFGITEIHTDKGLITTKEHIDKYLQFREDSQSFSFVNESNYINEKELCSIQLRLDDTIFVQKRKYIKLSEIFSRIGGYMQLIYTLFSLLSSLINKFDSELKIINSIFNFDLEKKKMALKYQSLKDFSSIKNNINNKNLIFSSSIKNIKKQNTDNKSSSNIFIMNNNISSVFNMSENKKIEECQNSKLEINKTNNNNLFDESANIKSRKIKNKKLKNIKIKNCEKTMYIDRAILPKIDIFCINKESNNNLTNFNEKIKLNLIDYIFRRKNKNIKKYIDLYHLGIDFYKKRMDLIHAFTLLLITERILLKKNK